MKTRPCEPAYLDGYVHGFVEGQLACLFGHRAVRAEQLGSRRPMFLLTSLSLVNLLDYYISGELRNAQKT